ncbi:MULTISPECIES: NUDIX hydrolase [Paenibacillus]|uniref:NUDIX hydrolase n=1 Tax=Paenibacillus radicis (ex Xue et al. 2023) TaxID=2972489 RepID=A0ABT1YQQ8_9BACL|nr:NUDIX hydrolase [Paenibacillus radicis (ex Xue et al. 2023)]MCR8635506.1 NUDIX hydrolase [Paenibacillus radicis (ex Xue et al. 2023)]
MKVYGVKVVALYKNKLVIVKQFREGKKRFTYELPGGRIENNEDLKEGARRELSEETGLVAGSLIELGTFSIPKSPVVITLFFTNDIVELQNQQLDKDEDIHVLFIDVAEAFAHVASGKWQDTRLGFGLVLARSNGLL